MPAKRLTLARGLMVSKGSKASPMIFQLVCHMFYEAFQQKHYVETI